MDATILDEVAWQIDLPQLKQQLGIKQGDSYAAEAEGMAAKAEAIGKPKAMYKAGLIESRGDDHVVIEGRTFKSRVLAVNLEKVHRVFPFVATCGVELEEWSSAFTSALEKYWADAIKGMALGASILALLEHIKEQHHPGDVSMMNPGSIQSWSLSEQRALFSILGAPEDSIGVELMESCFMKPGMSVSGMWFPTEHHFENCMLCPMENCPGRRAPYDKELYDGKYKKDSRG
jgi:hypothetical protein